MTRKLLLWAFILTIFFDIPVEGKEGLLTDEMGRKMKIVHPIKRIVSLAPSITEILFDMGLNEEIVGVTNFCDYPKAVLNKPRIGGFVNPSIEKIVSLKPDLIIGIRDGNRIETIHRLDDLGFSVYMVDPKGFNGVMKTIQNIGEIVARKDESKRMIRDTVMRKEKIVRFTQSLPKPKVFFQVCNAPMITVGRETLTNDLIRMAGGRSISEDESSSYPLYSIEAVILKSPEVIIISSMEKNKNSINLVKEWQNWKSIPAVKSGSIYVIDSDLVDRPAPRIAEGLEELARVIHADAFR